MRWLLTAAVIVSAMVAAGTAHAYEDKLTLGIEAGFASVVIPETDLPCCGALLGIESSVGLSDVFSLRGHLAYAYHFGSDPLHVSIFGAELLYLVDIVEAVPFFGAGLDAIGSYFQSGAALELGAHLTAGLEYLLDRESLVAVDLRVHYLPLSFDDRIEPVYFTANVRYSVMLEL